MDIRLHKLYEFGKWQLDCEDHYTKQFFYYDDHALTKNQFLSIFESGKC